LVFVDVSWDEADPSDLVSITPSKTKLSANESFEVRLGNMSLKIEFELNN
jgi:hypothetical protein